MAIQNKRHGMLTTSVVFRDVCPHTAARAWALMELFNWELFRATTRFST
jgi:hypothetical protein